MVAYIPPLSPKNLQISGLSQISFNTTTVPTWCLRLLVLGQEHQRTSSSQTKWVFPESSSACYFSKLDETCTAKASYLLA